MEFGAENSARVHYHRTAEAVFGVPRAAGLSEPGGSLDRFRAGNGCDGFPCPPEPKRLESVQVSMHFSLAPYGIQVGTIYRNLSPAVLYEHALEYDAGSAVTDSGALVAMSGEKTGRSPLDKRVIEEESSRDDVWWGDVNIGLDEQSYEINRARAIDYLNTRERLYCVDAFAGWDPKHRI